jgi:hypothetical protein
MKLKFTLFALILTTASFGQQLVQPGLQIVDRYKPSVPSLTIKANPLTLFGKYIDAGIEYRNQRSGWVLMNHSYFGDESSVRYTELSDVYAATTSYVRFEAAHRWYRQNATFFRANVERFNGIYFTAGGSSFVTSDSYDNDPNGNFIFYNPLTTGTRIDLIVGAEFGRTRNYFGQSSPLYAETMWKIGYNLGAGFPQILYGLRFNYKAN